MKRGILLALIITLLLTPIAVVNAAPPPDGPPGLKQAIEAKERHVDMLLGVPGVVGAGVGYNRAGNPAVVVFTDTSGVRGLPVFLDGVPVVTSVSGKFFARPKPDNPGKPPKEPEEPLPTEEWPRPVPIGVSTGHPDITAGTIGVRVTDGVNVYALSNNHVYANENLANTGDNVLQPGPYDGGVNPDDAIGTLFDYAPIDFSGPNIIDAAIALASVATLDKSTPSNGYGTPQSTTLAVDAIVPGLRVLKYGRTTGQTKGRVYAINATINVGYDQGVATFINQIVITPGAFSAGGDSGSLIVVDAKRSSDHLKPVGLLFAGSDLFTIANPIDVVLDHFGVTIDGS